MKKKIDKIERRKRRHKRIRAKVFGTSEKPRVSVFRTNKHIYVQLIDDVSGKTLAMASSLELKEKISGKEKAIKVAELFAKRAKEKNIRKVVFDRGGFSYIGRVKVLADTLRKEGLEF